MGALSGSIFLLFRAFRTYIRVKDIDFFCSYIAPTKIIVGGHFYTKNIVFSER